MAEKVGSIYFDLDLDDAKFNAGMDKANNQTKSFGSRLKENSLQLAALGAAATLALNKVVAGFRSAIDAAVKQQNALMGLNSIARAFGEDAKAAENAAKDLAADGLMPIGDAAASLKNLLASGFSLPEAIKLMNGFKDAAAFGRQGSLEFGQSIVGATEGIKNGNSVLVDNAGITKNLSNILVEAGYSAQDLSKASSDAGVRQAIFNGILKEAKPMMGDAQKLSESFGGAQARMGTQVTQASVALGEALQPVLTKIMEKIAPLIDKFIEFAKANPKLVAAIAIALTVMLALVAVLGLIGAAVGAILAMGTVGVWAAAIAAAIAVLTGVFIYFWDHIKAGFNWIKGAIGKIADWFKDNFDTIKKVVLTVLAVAFAPLLLAIGAIVLAFKAIVWVVKTLWSVFTTVFNAIWAVVSFVFNAIMMLWNTILSPVFNAIIFIVTSLFKIWWAVFTGILSIVTTVISTIAQIIFVILQGVWNFIYNKFLLPIGRFFAQIFKAIWGTISFVLGLIWEGIKWYFNTIFGFAKSVFNAVWGFVRWVWNGIKNAIIDPIAGAARAVWNKAMEIKNAVANGVRSAINWVKDRFNEFVGAGKNLIDGLVSGVTNAKDAVVNKVKEICSGALDAVKNFFGIKSPSRLMARMGDYLMEGFQSGIQRAGDQVVRTAEAISNRVNDGINTGVGKVQDGASKITGIYSGMYNSLNSMATQGAMPLGATSSAIMNAANANEASGGAIAQAPITVAPNFNGIVARSRSEWRDIVADGIEAVNEDLIARGHTPIGDGKVRGSTNGQ